MMQEHDSACRRAFASARSREVGVVVVSFALTACPFGSDDFAKVDGDNAGAADGSIDLSTIDSASATVTSSSATVATGSGSTSTGSVGGACGALGICGSAASAAVGGSGGGVGDASTGGNGGSGATGGSGGSGGTGGLGGSEASGGTSGVGGSGGTGGSGGVGGADCVPLEERCDGVDNDCNGEVDDGACPDGCAGFVIEDASYMYCIDAVSGSEAAALCEEHDLGQVQIESEDENAALLAAVQILDEVLGGSDLSQNGFWLGASDAEEEGTWAWIGSQTVFWVGEGDGEPVDDAYSNWASNRPNDISVAGEDCAVAYLEAGNDGDPGEWNDVRCSDDYPVVCE